jgi:LysR family glycine cleavage system transcriptional activator
VPSKLPANLDVSNCNSRYGLPPFAALRAFEAVGRVGSLRRAAHALDLDHAVVSRHLRGLEIWTGVALIERMPGGVVLTEAGARYYERITAVFREIGSATDELMHRDDEHRLLICCVPGFAYQWLMGRLDHYRANNPGMNVELHPTDAAPDFARFEADAYIHYQPAYTEAPPALQSVRSVEIASPGVFAVASPAYLAGCGEIRSPEDLLKLHLLHEEDQANWRAWFGAHDVVCGERLPGARFWHAHLTIEAAKRGQGVVLVNRLLVADLLASGDLVQVCGHERGCEPVVLGSYILDARSDRWNSARVAKFRSWLQMGVRTAMIAP